MDETRIGLRLLRGLLRLFLLGLLVFAGASSARAATVQVFPMRPKSGVSMKLASWYAMAPASGFVPMELTIKNSSGATRTWTMRSTTPEFYGANSWQISSSGSFTVEHGATRSFKLLVPIRERSTYSYSAAQLDVSGFGVSMGSQFNLPTAPYSGGRTTPFLVMSDRLSPPIWSKLEDEVKKRGMGLDGTPVTMAEFPEDWRALSGAELIYLRAEELAAFSPAQRSSLLDWLSVGGQLTIMGQSEVPDDMRWTALGSVKAIAAKEVDVAATTEELEHSSNRKVRAGPGGFRSWDAYNEIGAVRPNAPLLSICMLAFAIVIGPVNLFALASDRKRARLFWTTPAIAVGASVLLFVIILLQDGFGGRGVRQGLIYLQPERKRAVLLQEQLSRTGVLVNSSFTVREQAVVSPMWAQELARRRAPSLTVLGTTDFRGDWFRSRSLQAQRLCAIVPTRAELTVVSGGTGAPPVVVSSIEGALRDVYYRDRKNKVWTAPAVATGVRTTLQPADAVPKSLEAGNPRDLVEAFERVEVPPGSFYAQTSDPKFLIPTLSSIRWKQSTIAIVGPVTEARP